jgi:hypothetical protein
VVQCQVTLQWVGRLGSTARESNVKPLSDGRRHIGDDALCHFYSMVGALVSCFHVTTTGDTEHYVINMVDYSEFLTVHESARV